MRTPWVVSARRYHEGGRDDQGNAVDAWDEPVALSAFGWEPVDSGDPNLEGHDRTITHLRLLMPLAEVSSRDRIVLPGDTRLWEVDGHPADYTTGPFGYRPGMAVTLKHVEG